MIKVDASTFKLPLPLPEIVIAFIVLPFLSVITTCALENFCGSV